MTDQQQTSFRAIADQSVDPCHPALLVVDNTGHVISIPRDTHHDQRALELQRLITAAPELLSALEKALWLCHASETYRGAGCASPRSWSIDDQTRRTQALAGAAAAIAKAKGIA